MTDKIKRISQLVLGHLNDELSYSESIELEEWLAHSPANRIWFDGLNTNLPKTLIQRAIAEQKNKLDWHKFTDLYFPQLSHTKAKIVSINRWRSVAASIFMILLWSGVVLMFFKKQTGSVPHAQFASMIDIAAPVGNNTKLTLAKDSRITSEVSVNTLSTGYGGYSKVVLPDHSIVWLNSLSSISFPDVFTGASREVELRGEGYFEIVRNKDMLFRITVNGTKVEVLGANFNVMAYTNEKEQKITLFSGVAKIGAQRKSLILLPGQQANVDAVLSVTGIVDPEPVIAWVKGEFNFKYDNIETIMRQLARWYNVEVEYEEKSNVRLSGSISKSKNLSEVISLFKLSGVSFHMEGRTLIVQ